VQPCLPNTCVATSAIGDTGMSVDINEAYGRCTDTDCILDAYHPGVHESRYGTCWYGNLDTRITFPPTQRANSVRRSSERTMQLFGLPTTKVQHNGVMCDVTPTDTERHPITPSWDQHRVLAWGGRTVRVIGVS
jgi:hypothetical protein